MQSVNKNQMKKIPGIFSVVIFLIQAAAWCVAPSGLSAQTLSPKAIPGSGGYAQGGGNSLSWTMGETFNTTSSAGVIILSQGQQQPEMELITGTIGTSTLCAGSAIVLSYAAAGYYGSANTFTAQLSDAAGSFASPVNIGSIAATSGGTINCTIPVLTFAGNGYRLRVTSNHPAYSGKKSIDTYTVSSATSLGNITISSAPASGCVGSTGNISVTPGSGATFYNWSCPEGGILFDGNPGPYQSASPEVTLTFTTMPASGVWNVCMVAGNACGSTFPNCAIISASAAAAAPSVIAGAAIACPGTSGNAYSVDPVQGAAGYAWSGSAGITVNGSGQNVTVDFSGSFTSGTLCVHTLTLCGTGSADYCISISRSTSQPGIISGGSVCPNSSGVFSIVPVTNAVSYNWTCSVAGALITPNGTSCTVLFPANISNGSGICVSAISACGFASVQRCKILSTGAPAKPSSITGQASGLCGAGNVVYTVSSVAGAAGYFWSVSGGAVISGPNNLSTVTINFPSSFNNITISASAVNNCGTGAAKTLMVKGSVVTPSSISGNSSVCNGATEIYTANGSPGAASFTWTKPAGATILGSATGSSISVLWGATGGNITAKATNACGTSGKATLGITVSCRNALGENAAGSAGIFPNPAHGKVTVKFTGIAAEKIRLQLTGITGQVLLSEELTAEEGVNYHELDLANFAAGIYMVHLVSEERKEVLKVIVER
jgi:hypothetical protein